MERDPLKKTSIENEISDSGSSRLSYRGFVSGALRRIVADLLFIDREPGQTTILLELSIDIAKFKSLELQNIPPNPKNLLVVLLVEYNVLKRHSMVYHFLL
jgi:hypothetical protein